MGCLGVTDDVGDLPGGCARIRSTAQWPRRPGAWTRVRVPGAPPRSRPRRGPKRPVGDWANTKSRLTMCEFSWIRVYGGRLFWFRVGAWSKLHKLSRLQPETPLST